MLKRLTFVLLLCALMATFHTKALASTLGVSVEPGVSAYLELYSEPDAGYGPKVGVDWGVNDQWLLQFGFQAEGDDKKDSFNPAIASLGARYEFTEQLAATLNYDHSDDEKAYTLGLVGKLDLSEPLALSGKLEYGRTRPDAKLDGETADTTTLAFFTGFEYQALENLIFNLGYEVDRTSYVKKALDRTYGDDTTTLYTVGAEWAVNQYTLYFDYDMPNGNDGENTLTLGVSYAF